MVVRRRIIRTLLLTALGAWALPIATQSQAMWTRVLAPEFVAAGEAGAENVSVAPTALECRQEVDPSLAPFLGEWKTISGRGVAEWESMWATSVREYRADGVSSLWVAPWSGQRFGRWKVVEPGLLGLHIYQPGDEKPYGYERWEIAPGGRVAHVYTYLAFADPEEREPSEVEDDAWTGPAVRIRRD